MEDKIGVPLDTFVNMNVEMAEIKRDVEHVNTKLDEISILLTGCGSCKLEEAVNKKDTDSKLGDIRDDVDKIEEKLHYMWFFLLIARNPKVALVIALGLYGLAVSGYGGKLLGLL